MIHADLATDLATLSGTLSGDGLPRGPNHPAAHPAPCQSDLASWRAGHGARGGAREALAPELLAPELLAPELLASARRFIDEDVHLARLYLDRLSQLFLRAPTGQEDTQAADDSPIMVPALVPERAQEAGPLAQGGAQGVAKVAAKGGLAGWQLRKVLAHVDTHLGQPITTRDLASVARLSTGHFCRAFKASMHETPHGYVMRQRVRRSQLLMLESADSLSQIASACGLTDQAHLTRLFRRATGTTPMLWRRRWQAEGRALHP